MSSTKTFRANFVSSRFLASGLRIDRYKVGVSMLIVGGGNLHRNKFTIQLLLDGFE